jgi:hypothetical protein
VNELGRRVELQRGARHAGSNSAARCGAPAASAASRPPLRQIERPGVLPHPAERRGLDPQRGGAGSVDPEPRTVSAALSWAPAYR